MTTDLYRTTRRGRLRKLALAESVEEHTGNVHVVVAKQNGSEPAAEPGTGQALAGWTIRDDEGAVLGPALSTRAEAVRTMGVLAYRGGALPLVLYGPDGQPTGDRLA